MRRIDCRILKIRDLNSRSDEAGFSAIAGTARQMGLEIVD
jgi:ribosomal protein L11